jgi:glycolate oxidase FAD binding subunit
MSDKRLDIQQQVLDALQQKQSLIIRGGGSKTFLTPRCKHPVLSTIEHQGIIDFHPAELVLTARAGTLLKDLEAALSEAGQILPFEPPSYTEQATLGGAVATGLSGAMRPFTGSVRDFVLGCTIINGKGEILKFGGQVMKNVAGYDVSRLMVGAMGTLGVLLDISIKVLPAAPCEQHLAQSMSQQQALHTMRRLASQNLPLNGLAYDGGQLHIRLAGTDSAVETCRQKLGGEAQTNSNFWLQLRDQRHPFFQQITPLWRVSVPPASKDIEVDGDQFIDWGGGLRWLKTTQPAEEVFDLAASLGGHARIFRHAMPGQQRQPILPDSLLRIHQKIKRSFDPQAIFNPGQLYPDF